MPRPIAEGKTYLPGLDGLRGLAVLAVLGYHLGVPHFAGGLLGVGMFFTLSGFLITRILLTSWDRTGTFQLKTFWVRRARRLLPAVVVVLGAVLLWTALTQPDALAQRWGETWSALAYVANWHTIAQGQSYFERFTGPGPLDHLWSLSVEEQFYVVWPVLLVLALRVARLSLRTFFVVTAALAVGSFALLSVLASPGFDNTRAYEGTDTRAGGILVGALLAIAWPAVRRAAERGRWLRPSVEVLGVVGVVGIGWLVATTDDYSMSLYSHGLLLLSLCTVALVAAVSLPGSVTGRVLGAEPLRWLGERSYGIYLWQLPLVAAISVTTLAEHRLLWSLVVTAATLTLAELSWRLVEDPIRRHGFRGAFRGADRRLVHTSSGYRVVALPLLPVGTVAVCLVGTFALVSCQTVDPDGDDTAQLVDGNGMPPLPPPVPEATTTPTPSPSPPSTPPSTALPSPPTKEPQTACERVAHIGESTSVGLVSPAYLPDRSARLPAQLRLHGVKEVRTDIAGARSIVERWHDQPNAQEGVEALGDDGFSGCWTIAMGTNDTANQVVGGAYPYSKRIDLLMKQVQGEPVLWLTVKSLRSSGPYDDQNMRAFDKALVDACERYPNLHVYDWRAEVRDSWFISDGIHFTTPGYAQRARRIAEALARAYPAGRPAAPSCVVSSGMK